MMKKRVPWRPWDYGIEWVCEVMSLTANSNFVLTGETPNISEYLDFGYYNSVLEQRQCRRWQQKFGLWLGVSQHFGSFILFWILMEAGNVISRMTVQRINTLELTTTEVKQRLNEYDECIKELLKDNNLVVPDNDERFVQDWDDHTGLDNEDFARV